MSYPDGGRNVRSVWEIATQPYPDAHFATFPEELPRRCILAGTSEHGVCPECGAPWERVVENRGVRKTHGVNEVSERTQRRLGATSVMRTGVVPVLETMGWLPSCDCGEVILRNPVPATVLDPFTGSGTTNHVARKHGRRSIGIELNPVYAQLCAKRMSQLSLLA